MRLSEKHCSACAGNPPTLSEKQASELIKQLRGWKIEGAKYLKKSYRLADFAQALALANKIGAIAESENHHPDLLVRWGGLAVTLWTHSVDGLTENDFILAAKIDGQVKD
jgi:4a-hydroxytetrahydrobiopterin dehydratase